jgi:hypothetical protein
VNLEPLFSTHGGEMDEKDDLLEQVATTIRTYRAGQVDALTPHHVGRWLDQFTSDKQVPLLRELNHVLKNSFFTKEWIIGFLETLSENQKLAGATPANYWASANILSIQQVGQSQREMVGLLGEALRRLYGVELAACGAPGGDYIYLDDGIFSGSRAASDLGDWIRNHAPPFAKLRIIVIALHAGGFYWVKSKLEGIAHAAGKHLTIDFWRAGPVENRRTYKDVSNVLWPSIVPNSPEVEANVAMLAAGRFPLQLRNPGAAQWPFSSEEGRQVLESEFWIAGARIKARVVGDKEYFRPLGFGSFGAGFGTMLVTYRNCPNNAPLALWWGDGGVSTPALDWYPLFKRRTN